MTLIVKRISTQAYEALTDTQRRRISRIPLRSDELSALIETAVNLHSRAVEDERERRWWVEHAVAFTAAASGLVGTVVGALIAS